MMRFECPCCTTTFPIHRVNASIAEGTCPTCGQRFQVSMERRS